MSIAATCPECRSYTCICQNPIPDLLTQIEEARQKDQAIKEQMALTGEGRCWLNGGVNNPGSKEPTVITIYGELSGYDRQCLLMLTAQIDRSPVETEEP